MHALIGLGIFCVTAFLFWRTLPRNGKVHPLVGTQWEPYFVILFLSGAAIGVGLIIVWAVDRFL
jgi:hypothetical protein